MNETLQVCKVKAIIQTEMTEFHRIFGEGGGMSTTTIIQAISWTPITTEPSQPAHVQLGPDHV